MTYKKLLGKILDTLPVTPSDTDYEQFYHDNSELIDTVLAEYKASTDKYLSWLTSSAKPGTKINFVIKLYLNRF